MENQSSANEGRVEQLVPRVGEAREAPVAAVQAAVGAVEGRVCIFSVLGEQCDVKQIYRFLDSAQHFVHYNCCLRCACWIPQPEIWLCFAFTWSCWLVPFPSPANFFVKKLNFMSFANAIEDVIHRYDIQSRFIYYRKCSLAKAFRFSATEAFGLSNDVIANAFMVFHEWWDSRSPLMPINWFRECKTH